MIIKTSKYKHINILWFWKKYLQYKTYKKCCVSLTLIQVNSCELWQRSSGQQLSVQLTEMKLALGVPHHVPQRHKATNSLRHGEKIHVK